MIANSTGLSMYGNTCESSMMSSLLKAEKVSVSSTKAKKVGVSSTKAIKESNANISSTKANKEESASISSTKSEKGMTEAMNVSEYWTSI